MRAGKSPRGAKKGQIPEFVSHQRNGDTNMRTLNEILKAISEILAILFYLEQLGWLYAASAWFSTTFHGSFALANAAIGGGLTLFPHM